ncbi:MAG: hypothetical protein ACHQO8_01065 [Vicinamibacterales bacterium]
MFNLSIGPQAFKRDFLDGRGNVSFDLPAGLKPADPFANTTTTVTAANVAGGTGDLTFGDPEGLSMSASMSAANATSVELTWPQAPSEFTKAYGLVVPDGRVGARLHLEGQASGKFSGGVPVPAALANFEFGLKAGSQVSYDRFCLYDATTTAVALLQDLVTGLALPQHAGTPASLPRAGEVLVFGYSGFLDLQAALTCGYALMGHQGFALNDLEAAVEYGLRLKASVSVGCKIGGDFEMSSRLGSRPGWVALTVKKARSSALDFAAAFQADAIAAVEGLPDSADEFLSALLGADVRNALEVFQRIRASSDLDTLRAQTDKILLSSVTNLANKWLGRALDRANVGELQTAIGKLVDEYHAADAGLTSAVVHLYEDAVDHGTTDRLAAALAKIAALSTRDDLARLDDSDAWALITRLSGGHLTSLLADDATLGEVKTIAQTALDFLHGGWQPRLRDVVDELKSGLPVDRLFGALAKQASKDGLMRLADATLQGVAERLLGLAWDRIKASDLGQAAADLHAALDRIDDFKTAWYKKLGDALHQSYSLSANYAYTRASSGDALIDVEIDVSQPAGQALFHLAAHGQFATLFDRPNLALIHINHGVLTHQLTASMHLQINVFNWEQTRLVEVISRTTNSVEVQSTGLVNVFTTEASIRERVEKTGYQLESTFLVRMAGAATPAARADGDKRFAYLIRNLQTVGVTYNLAVADQVTTPAELTQYLELAEYLRLIPSARALAATLSSEFPRGLGAVTATYVAKYDNDGILEAFRTLSGDPLRAVVQQASRYLVSAHLIASSHPLSELVTIGFAYRDPANAAVFYRDGFTGLRDANGTVVIPGWFTGGAPREVSLPSGDFKRMQLVTLYSLERDTADRLARLDAVIDATRDRRAPVDEAALETAARKFVEAAAEINNYGTINTFFAVFDAFVQQGNAGRVRRDSTLILQITPAGSANTVTKYLMSR